MSSQDDIKQCIETYYEALRTSSSERVRAVFHPNARITGYLPDGLHEMTLEEFSAFVGSQQPSPVESGEEAMMELLSCEIAGQTAGVRLRESYLGMVFLDTLSMLQCEGEWRIYNKLFHVEQ